MDGSAALRRLGQHLGFAIYRSHDDYQPSVLPTGATAGSPEDALNTACGFYLGDRTVWITEPPEGLTGRTTRFPVEVGSWSLGA